MGMKAHLYILFSFLLLIACDNDDCCVTPPESEVEITLIGEWRLDKLCFSDGASTCNEDDLWEPDYTECVTFTADTFSFDRDGELCTGTYTITDFGFSMTADATSTCIFESIDYQILDHKVDRIVMSPFCTEGCPHVYVRK